MSVELDYVEIETLRLALRLIANEKDSEDDARRALAATMSAFDDNPGVAQLVTLNAARILADAVRQRDDEAVANAQGTLLFLVVGAIDDEDGAA